MIDTPALDRLAFIIMVGLVFIGIMCFIFFLYAVGWAIIGLRALYKRFQLYIQKKKLARTDQIISEVDMLLKQQHSDYIFGELAKL